MKSIFRLFVLVLLVVGWGLAALSLHVIRTPDEVPITLVPKDQFGIKDTYVDTRKWTLDDAAEHPQLVAKLIESGKANVLKHLVTDPKAGDVAAQLNEAIQRGSTTNPTSVHGQAHAASRSTQPATAAAADQSALRGLLDLFK
jgi:hypothetical protein